MQRRHGNVPQETKAGFDPVVPNRWIGGFVKPVEETALADKARIPITLVSDSTGSLGEHMLNAVLTQFPSEAFAVRGIKFVNNPSAEKACLQTIGVQESGLVVHATVSSELKQKIEALCAEKKLAVLDLTRPLSDLLSQVSGFSPSADTTKLHELNEPYFKKVKAIEYTIDHDDGHGLSTLDKADIVLAGISRTTKTPTSMVLALQGYACANVPLVLDVDPPRQLQAVDPDKVVCLVMRPQALSAVRSGRIQTELGYDGGYADLDRVKKETVHARRWAEKLKWPVLDVTGRAIEETAVKVLQSISSRA